LILPLEPVVVAEITVKTHPIAANALFLFINNPRPGYGLESIPDKVSPVMVNFCSLSPIAVQIDAASLLRNLTFCGSVNTHSKIRTASLVVMMRLSSLGCQ
jgi:hypothetical protein